MKRFRSRGRVRRLADGRRARREARMLERLRALELPVPAVLGLRREAGGWELVLEAIEGACPLEALIARGRTGFGARDAEALGATLGRAHAAGFLHGDLHPGNLLRREDGAWFLVDVGGGSLTPVPAPARRRAELASLLGAMRERAEESALVALWRAWRDGLDDRARLAPDVEWSALAEEARRLRHASVRAHEDRWLRPSSRVRPVERSGRRWLIDARSADAERALESIDSPSGFVVHTGRDVRDRWLRAARANEHELPSPRPLALAADGRVALLGGARGDAPRPLAARDEGAEHLARALDDRGLWTRRPPLVERGTGGALLLSPAGALPVGFRETPRRGDPLGAWFDASAEAPRG